MTAAITSVSEQTVHAYVDGELSAHEAAALLRRMAGDPDLAEQVATLTRLKSELRDLPLPPGLRAPDLAALEARLLDGRPGRRPGRWPGGRPATESVPGIAWWGRLAGMAAAVAVVLAGMWLLGPRAGSPGGLVRSDMVTAAVARHLEWLKGPAARGGNERDVTLTAFARRHGQVYVPDLGASGLHIVRTAPFADRGVQLGYVGVHDCRLSLFILPDAGARPTPLQEVGSDAARVFVWRTNRLDYLLVAAHMDPSRLDLISTAVFDATRNLQPFSPATQLALEINHRTARSCAIG